MRPPDSFSCARRAGPSPSRADTDWTSECARACWRRVIRPSSSGFTTPSKRIRARLRRAETPRAATEKSGLLGARDPPEAAGQGLRVLRRGRQADHGAERPRANPRAHDPARLGGGLDLPVSVRAYPGDRDRRGRTQAVPLPRPLARAARPREVRVDGGVRPRPAAPAAAGG